MNSPQERKSFIRFDCKISKDQEEYLNKLFPNNNLTGGIIVFPIPYYAKEKIT